MYYLSIEEQRALNKALLMSVKIIPTPTDQRVAGLGAVTPTNISAVPVAVTNGRDAPAPTKHADDIGGKS